MTRLDKLSTPTELNLLVAFTDLAGFHRRFVMPGDDRKVFDTMQDYFAWTGKLVQDSGGYVIKCMGDAMLLAYPAEIASQAVMALKELKVAGDEWLKLKAVPCQQQAKAHLGTAIAGPVGAPGQERLDVYGKTVNICATLQSGALVLTPQVFRALDAPTRKHFKKHTPPVIYVRVEDAH